MSMSPQTLTATIPPHQAAECVALSLRPIRPDRVLVAWPGLTAFLWRANSFPILFPAGSLTTGLSALQRPFRTNWDIRLDLSTMGELRQRNRTIRATAVAR